MKIALFEDILERHARRSLARALRARGHQVIETSPVWHGHRFPKDNADISRIFASIEGLAGEHPDVLLNFRAATLTPEMLQFLRTKNVRTFVWLPDDPVLHSVCYRHIVEHYDSVLNCGDVPVLCWYEKHHGIKGINFPFWTDNIEFPRLPLLKSEDSFDVAFLGNVRGTIRNWRYSVLSALPGTVRVFGNIDFDPKGLGHGYLNSEAEIARTLRHARIGFNIPQVFSHYRGHRYDFMGLAELGSFQYPSRVIQYAAIGLPVMTYGLVRPPTTFPEMIVSPDPASSARMVKTMLADTEALQRVGDATTLRFHRSFSAAARAEFFEAIVMDSKGFKSAPADNRACMFAGRGLGTQPVTPRLADDAARQ